MWFYVNREDIEHRRRLKFSVFKSPPSVVRIGPTLRDKRSSRADPISRPTGEWEGLGLETWEESCRPLLTRLRRISVHLKDQTVHFLDLVLTAPSSLLLSLFHFEFPWDLLSCEGVPKFLRGSLKKTLQCFVLIRLSTEPKHSLTLIEIRRYFGLRPGPHGSQPGRLARKSLPTSRPRSAPGPPRATVDQGRRRLGVPALTPERRDGAPPY